MQIARLARASTNRFSTRLRDGLSAASMTAQRPAERQLADVRRVGRLGRMATRLVIGGVGGVFRAMGAAKQLAVALNAVADDAAIAVAAVRS